MVLRLSLALIGLSPALAYAVPMALTHQLRLLDGAGTPISGTHDVGVALWTAGAGGVMRWSETQHVTLDRGYVALRLGADAANPLTDAILDGAALWVGVTVDGGAELPTRSPIGAVPYSVHAGRADTALSANAVPATGTVDVGALPVGPGAAQVAAGDHTHPAYTGGAGVTVSGTTVAIDGGWLALQRRLDRYDAVCIAAADAGGYTYANVSAVTPGDSAVVMSGTSVCANWVGNNSQTAWTCIGVPYIYNHIANANGYYGTDTRPTWSSCGTVHGADGYPWLDPAAATGVMMACCIK